MTDKEARLRQVIADFEDRKTDGQTTVRLIHDLTGEAIELGYLSEYWASESLDTFVEKLLVEHIADWQDINDKKAIELINEIQANPTRESIAIRNSVALERRYSKPSGTVISKIVHHGISDASALVEELKKETRIFL